MMFILTLKDTPEGVYSVRDDQGEHIIPIFESEDDADRYYFHIEESGDYPPMQVYEIEKDAILNACNDRNQKYAIISQDDLLLPPDDIEE